MISPVLLSPTHRVLPSQTRPSGRLVGESTERRMVPSVTSTWKRRAWPPSAFHRCSPSQASPVGQ